MKSNLERIMKENCVNTQNNSSETNNIKSIGTNRLRNEERNTF